MPFGATRDLGGRSFLTAGLLVAHVFHDTQPLGDQEWSPSRCATRKMSVAEFNKRRSKKKEEPLGSSFSLSLYGTEIT